MRAASQVPYLVLLPERFAMPRFLRRERWSLKPPFHPYPCLSARAVFSLWHCLSASPYVVTSRVYLRPDRSYAAPRPMEFGLSSRNLRCERPSALPRRVQGGGWMRVWRVGNFLGACLKMGGPGAGEFWVWQGGERRGRPSAVCSARILRSQTEHLSILRQALVDRLQ